MLTAFVNVIQLLAEFPVTRGENANCLAHLKSADPINAGQKGERRNESVELKSIFPHICVAFLFLCNTITVGLQYSSIP